MDLSGSSKWSANNLLHNGTERKEDLTLLFGTESCMIGLNVWDQTVKSFLLTKNIQKSFYLTVNKRINHLIQDSISVLDVGKLEIKCAVSVSLLFGTKSDVIGQEVWEQTVDVYKGITHLLRDLKSVLCVGKLEIKSVTSVRKYSIVVKSKSKDWKWYKKVCKEIKATT